MNDHEIIIQTVKDEAKVRGLYATPSRYNKPDSTMINRFELYFNEGGYLNIRRKGIYILPKMTGNLVDEIFSVIGTSSDEEADKAIKALGWDIVDLWGGVDITLQS